MIVRLRLGCEGIRVFVREYWGLWVVWYLGWFCVMGRFREGKSIEQARE